MDFIAHLLWSWVIFAGPQVYWAIFFGVLPDFLPFGSHLVVYIVRRCKGMAQRRFYGNFPTMQSYFNLPENQWVYRVYNYTHSLVVWFCVFCIGSLIGIFLKFFPWALFAWLVHICMDIPTHTARFFAPRFLTPINTKIHVNGISWAHPIIMIVNYSCLILVLLIRLHQYGII